MHPADALKQYESALNTHSFGQVAPYISDEAIFWFSDGSHSGKEQIRRAFEQTWEKIKKETYWIEDLVWLTQNEQAASCTYHFHWKGEIDEKPLNGKGRGTTILRKEPDGWKIIHEHLSRFSG